MQRTLEVWSMPALPNAVVLTSSYKIPSLRQFVVSKTENVLCCMTYVLFSDKNYWTTVLQVILKWFWRWSITLVLVGPVDFAHRSKFYITRKYTTSEGCEMLRIPHCLDNRLKDGDEVVTLKRRLRSTPQKHFYLPLILISARDWVNTRA
jgi:hypothetical protein